MRLGEHDLNVKDNYEQDISVKNVVIHPSFGIGAKNLSTGKIGLYAEHDISLLELSKPAYFNERVSPVCVDSGFPDFAEGKSMDFRHLRTHAVLVDLYKLIDVKPLTLND